MFAFAFHIPAAFRAFIYRLLHPTVLIIGGSRGIGLALGKQWARFGGKVLLAARWTKGKPTNLPTGISIIEYDVTDKDGAAKFVQDVIAHFGGMPNHIYYNVGYSPEKETADQFDDVADTNYKGNARLMMMFAEKWKSLGKRSCKFYVMSSYVVFMNLPNCTVYRSTKVALESIALSIELMFGIPCYVINPGVVDTEIWLMAGGLVDWMKLGLLMMIATS
ncbi:MAG: 3-oxoacyl-(acyl-carrier-protein) reductase, partial [uncultured bacterium]